MFLLQMPLVKRIPAARLLALLVFSCLGLAAAKPVQALEITCGAGRCGIDGTQYRIGGSTPLLLSGSYSIFRLPLGERATVVEDLLASISNEDGCDSQSACASSSTAPNPFHLFAIRSRHSAGSLFSDWHFAARRIVLDRDQSPTHPGGITNPIPEPSAALIFGVGLLVASGLVTRTGSID